MFVLQLLNEIKGPPLIDTAFVEACGELNGKKFTFQNISKLQGGCYVSSPGTVYLEPCQEKHIERYIKLLTDTKIGKATLNTGTEEQRIFNISHGSLDNTWICSLKYIEQDQTIRAVAKFAYD